MQIPYLYIIRRVSFSNQFADNGVLLVLDLLQKGEDVGHLGQDDPVVVVLAELAADGEFVGTLHRLVEVAAQP